jgi:hypothetical protein
MVTTYRPERAELCRGSPQQRSRIPFFLAVPRTRAATLQDLRALCAEEDPANVAKLVALRDDPATPAVVQLGAVIAMMDRAHGKPTQTITNRIIRSVADLTDQELDALLASEEAPRRISRALR